MKNIHILPTENSSRISYNNDGVLELHRLQWRKGTQNMHITSNEDINENDYIITKDGRLLQVSYLLSKDLEDASKVILTTDQDLIKDGVWGIEDGFLEWFVKNPDCEFVELRGYAIILPGEWEEDIPEPKQETLEEVAERYYEDEVSINGFINGVKWQQEQDKNKYSEEEVIELLNKREDCINQTSSIFDYTGAKEWFEKFKKK